MKKIVWSSFQKAIFDEIAAGSGNVMVIARAGSAKSTSIIEGCKYLPKGKSATFCAFNRSIKDELKEKLPDYVDCGTIHGLSFRVVKTKFPDIIVDQFKTEKIVQEIVGKTKDKIDLVYNLCKIVSLCKGTLTDVPSKIETLAYDYQIDFCSLSKDKFISHVCQVLRKCKEDTKTLDFDDMIWFSFVFGLKPQQTDFVFIDECQDLNISQIEFALSMVKPNGRVFCVLDDFQCIYGWRGADVDVLERLKKRLNPKQLKLPISYRCPKLVVYLLQKYVPDIQAFSESENGEVKHIHTDDLIKYAKPGCFVISRTNAPLITSCMKFIRAGIRANILGKDIGNSLLFMIKKSKKNTVPDFVKWLHNWAKQENKELAKKGRSNAYVVDKLDCFSRLCDGANDIEQVKINIKNLFSDDVDGGVVLHCTGHASKGLERDDVFVLYDTMRHDSQAEKNIVYVSLSRTKKRLFLVSKSNNKDRP